LRPAEALALADLFLCFLIGAQLSDLRLRVEEDIGIQWIPSGVILVIGLGFEEGLERRHLGNDR